MKLVYSTFPTETEAKKISKKLLEENLCACVQIIPSEASMFIWQGKLEEEKEFLVLFKTSDTKAQALEAKLEELHGYECPCILTMDVKANDAYKKWVND